MALFNSGMPMSYQPMVYQSNITQPYSSGLQMPNMTTQGQPNNSSIIWVQGEAGAKSYLVAPNNTVQLWDSESQTIYLKSADASGMPTMKVLDYTIREMASNGPSMPLNNSIGKYKEYVTKDEFEAILGQIKALEDKVNGKEIRA